MHVQEAGPVRTRIRMASPLGFSVTVELHACTGRGSQPLDEFNCTTLVMRLAIKFHDETL